MDERWYRSCLELIGRGAVFGIGWVAGVPFGWILFVAVAR